MANENPNWVSILWEVGITVVGGLVVIVVMGSWHKYLDYRDSKLIYEFLKASFVEGELTFRTSHAISSHTKIPVSRVSELCSKHKKICRNQLEKESWRIDDRKVEC